MRNSPRLNILQGIAVLLWLAFMFPAHAQIYPVQSTTQLVPPYSVYLSDYAEPGNEKLRVILLQRDLTQASYALRLVMTVELNGQPILRTARTFNPAPIHLSPGAPTIISGADLAPYLDSRNIDFIGFSREQYERTRALPEGSYTITFTAYDYRRQDVQVSNAGSSFYFLAKNEPPLINFPACGSAVPLRTPQQIIFSWLPRNTASPNSVNKTQYEFSLYETRPPGRNPNDVVLSTPPVFRTTTEFTQLIYGPAEPLLLDGMTYVWRVRAFDTKSTDAFRNNGYSEVCTFTFGGINPDINIGVIKNLQAEGETERRAKIWWTKDEVDAYRVYYRKSKGDWEWFYSDLTTESLKASPEGFLKLFDLEAEVEYETRIQGRKDGYFGPYSDIVKFKMPAHKVVQCGSEQQKAPTDQSHPLLSATVGMTIDVDGIDMLLKVVEPLGNGWFKGVGVVNVPFLGGNFGVNFQRLFINDDRVAGYGNVYFISAGTTTMLIQQAENLKKKEQEKVHQQNRDAWSDVEFYEKTFHYDALDIEGITADNASYVTITDAQGVTTANAEVMQVLNSAPTKAIVVEDKNGDQWVVQKDKASGKTKVSKVEGGGLEPGGTSAAAPVALSNEAKLLGEMLGTFEKQITDVIGASYRTVLPGRGSPRNLRLLLALPAAMPTDHEKLSIVKDYVTQIKDDEKRLTALLTILNENSATAQLLTALAAKNTAGNKSFLSALSESERQQLEVAVCPSVVSEAKKEYAAAWWRAPYWVRAAKILEEHWEDMDIYETVTRSCTSTACTITGVVKLSDEASATMEVTFSQQQAPADLWSLLENTYGVRILVARDVTIESFTDWWWNYMAIKDDNLYQGRGWESAGLKMFADILMAAPGTIKGWVTDRHWRTGEDLAMWEHALGILDVVPAEAFAKAGVTALVIKIGSRFIDVAKLTAPIRNLLISARSVGLKLLVKSKDEIIIFARNGTQTVGRILNGVLQDLYWKYGGENVLARLAGVKYLDDSKKLVEGTLEVVEDGGEIGVRASSRFFKNIDDFVAAIERGEDVFYVGKHTDIVPRPSGVQSHHGINSVWMESTYKDYNPNIAPTVYMLNNPNHNATRGIFNTWIAKVSRLQGVTKGNVDYTKITEAEILELAKLQFDAAKVPQEVRDLYFTLWENFKRTLNKK